MLRDYVVVDAITVKSNLTPAHVAEMFWEMDEDEMIEFFNHLGRISDAGNTDAIAKQFKAVVETAQLDETLTSSGKEVILEMSIMHELLVGEDHA